MYPRFRSHLTRAYDTWKLQSLHRHHAHPHPPTLPCIYYSYLISTNHQHPSIHHRCVQSVRHSSRPSNGIGTVGHDVGLDTARRHHPLCHHPCHRHCFPGYHCCQRYVNIGSLCTPYPSRRRCSISLCAHVNLSSLGAVCPFRCLSSIESG